MERKIGEIFKHGDEWYQCVEGNYCKSCGFYQSNVPALECSKNFFCFGNTRKDKTSVIFKKLVKVGETYNIGKKVFQRYAVFVKPYIFNDEFFTINTPVEDFYISIEIKQNKENMQINKVVMNIDDRDYLLDRLEAILHDTHCQQYKDEICAALSKYIVTETASGLKPFNLDAAKAGKPICTRDGRKAIFLITLSNKNFPVGAIVNCGQEENIYQYDINGICDEHDENLDLMMLSKKKEGWVNVYKGNLYDTESEAKNAHLEEGYIDTIKITWEE